MFICVVIGINTAAAEGNIECMRLLLNSGAQLSCDRWNKTPFADAKTYASKTGDSEPMNLLRNVESKSAISVQTGVDSQKVTDSHQRGLGVTEMAMKASADGNTKTLEKLLEDGLDVNYSNCDRRTLLSVSIRTLVH